MSLLPPADPELYQAILERVKTLGPRVAADLIGSTAPTAALMEGPAQGWTDYLPNFMNAIGGWVSSKRGNESGNQTLDRVESANQGARELVGATPSDTPWDQVATVATNFLIPAPLAPIAAAGKGGRALGSLIAPGTGRFARTIQGTGQFLGELLPSALTPGRQTRTGVGNAFELGIPMGFVAGSAALNDAQAEQPSPFELPDFTAPQQSPVQQTASPFDLPDFDAAQEAQPSPFELPDSDVIEEQDEQWNASKVALVVGGVVAGAVAPYVLAKRLANRNVLNQSPYVGASRKTRLSGVGTMLKQAVVDRKAAIPAALEKGATTKPFVEEADALVSARGTPQAQARIIQEHMTTTVPLPRSTLSWSKAPGVVLDVVSRLTPPQRALYDTALIAYTKLDDLVRTRQPVWQGYSKGQRVGQPISRSELARNIHDARLDPVVSQAINDTHSIFRTLRDWMYEEGVITKKTHDYWKLSAPNYVPLSRDFADTAFLPFKQRMTEKMLRMGETILGSTKRLSEGQAESWQRFLPRNVQRSIPPGTLHSPIDLMESYVAQVIRQVENNHIRKWFIDKAKGDPTLQHFVRKAGPNKSRTIAIRENGKDVNYQILDDVLLDALHSHPAMVVPILNGTRRMLSATTTSTPFFAPVSALLETVTHFITQAKGIGGGPIDAAMKMMGMNKTLSDMIGFDPSIFLNAPIGTVMRLKDRFAHGMSRSLQAQLATDTGPAMKLLGPRNTKLLSDFLGRHYARSMTHFMGLHGGESSVFLTNKLIDELGTQLNKISPRYLETMSRVPGGKSALAQNSVRGMGMLLRATSAFNEAMFQSVKMVAARGSLPRNWHTMSPEQLMKIAAEIRQVGGDTTRTGISPAHRVMASSVPWWNTTVQIGARYGRAAVERKMRTAMAVSAIAYLTSENVYNVVNTSAEAAHDFFVNRTPGQRAAKWTMYNTDGTVAFELPVDQNLRPLVSMVTEMVGAVLGYTGGMRAKWDKTEGVKQALSSMSPLTQAPPLVNAVLGYFGKELPESLWSDRYEMRGTQKERVSGLEDNGRVMNTSIPAELDAVVRSLTGAIGASFLDGAYTYEAMRNGNRGFLESLKAGAGAALEQPVKMATLGTETWGQTYRNQVRDGTYTFVQGVDNSLKTAMDVAAEFRSPETTGSSGTKSPERAGYVSKYAGSEPLQFISMELLGLNKEVGRHKQVLRQLYVDRDKARIDPTLIHSTSVYNKEVNRINNEIKIVRDEIATAALAYEDSINEGLKSRGITKPFKINSFKPDEWIQ